MMKYFESKRESRMSPFKNLYNPRHVDLNEDYLN